MRRLVVESPLGALTLVSDGARLTDVLFSPGARPDAACRTDALLRETARELSEYFAGIRHGFTVPLAVSGTPFERDVFGALLEEVEYGTRVTYGELAVLSGHPRACRAVGNALHKNPLPILIPCHRVVGATGIGNYAFGIEHKRRLMVLEGIL